MVMRIAREVDDGRDNAKYRTATGAESLGRTRENENRTSLRVSLDPGGLSLSTYLAQGRVTLVQIGKGVVGNG